MSAHLDEQVAAFRNRPMDAGPYAFVWVDALTQKVREGGRTINVAALVAVGVNADGHREILGLDVASAGAVKKQGVALESAGSLGWYDVPRGDLVPTPAFFHGVVAASQRAAAALGGRHRGKIAWPWRVCAAARAASMSETTVRRGVTELSSRSACCPGGGFGHRAGAASGSRRSTPGW